MKRTLVGMFSVGMIAGMMQPVIAHAQQVAGAPEVIAANVMMPQSQPSSKTKVSPLATKVTVRIHGMGLREALEEIATQSGVRIVYGEAVGRSNRKVDMPATERSVGETLDLVLAGSGFSYRVTETGQILVAPTKRDADQGTITGKIIHGKTKQPIASARITVDGQDREVMTAQDGTFRMVVNSGERIVQIRALGFVNQTRRVSIGDGKTVTIEVELAPSASVLDEVIVTGTVVATERKAIPTPITVITAEDIEKRGITNIEQFFRGEVPGVIAQDMGIEAYSGATPGISDSLGEMVSSRIFVRGVSNLNWAPNPLKTYIDGVELLNPAYLGTIDPQSIERIEIVTGPQAATIYGSGAIGGVMQIFTKKGNSGNAIEFSSRLQYGVLQNSMSDGHTPRHNHSIGMTGGHGGQLTYSANVSYGYTGQWQPNLFNRTMGASLGATHIRGPVTVRASVSTTATETGVTRASAFVTELRNSGQWLISNPAAQNVQRRSTTSNQTLSLNADYQASSIWRHSVTIGRSQNVFNLVPDRPIFEDPADTLYAGISSTGMRTTLGYNTTVNVPRILATSSTLTVGATGSFGGQTQVRGMMATKTSTQMIAPVVVKPLDSKSWGMFGNWRFGVWDQLYFTTGVRLEKNPSYGRAHTIDFTPTNGLTYTIEYGEISLKLLASYGRATRPPTSSQRLEVLTNNASYSIPQWVSQLEAPDLRPEYSHGPQGGFELYYGNRGSFTINTYRQKISDLIYRIIADSFQSIYMPTGVQYWVKQTRFTNIATIKQYGVETSAMIRFGDFTLRGTYSWADSRIIESVPGYETTFPLGGSFSGVPTHTGNTILSYAHGATSISLTSDFIGMMNGSYGRLNRKNNERLRVYSSRYANPSSYLVPKPGYMKSNLNVAHRITPWASAALNMVNVGNRFISDNEYIYPTLGRQTSLGVSLRYPRTR